MKKSSHALLASTLLFSLQTFAHDDTPPESTPPPETSSFTPLWEGAHKDAIHWTTSTAAAIDQYGDALFDGTSDMNTFCPNYDRLGTRDRRNFWIQLIAAITKYESAFKPYTRYVETTMGKDPVTGQQVVSEGLLQLSYQDEVHYRSRLPAGVCDFDFEDDKRYALTDLRRSILNPENNLTCGVGILNNQIERTGKIAVASGAYWAVIKTNSKYNKLVAIRQITNDLDFCS